MTKTCGFHAVKIALREKIKRSGLPFFSQSYFEKEVKKVSNLKVKLEMIVFGHDQKYSENNIDDDDDSLINIKSKLSCKICLDQSTVSVCFLPCRHMVSCIHCVIGQLNNLSNSR